jgi:hypothetical protein
VKYSIFHHEFRHISIDKINNENPVTIPSWKIEIKRPLMAAGAISEIYIGDSIDAIPIPIPPIILNMTKIQRSGARAVPMDDDKHDTGEH